MVRTLVATLCLVSLTCLGCGSGGADLGEVTGKVTMDGTAMANVLVTFNPVEGGRSSSAATKDDGTYTLGYGQEAGAEIGFHNVSVTSIATVSGGMDSEMTSDSADYEAQSGGGSVSDYDNATVSEAIPAKYNTASTLQYEVKKGSNTINIELTK